MNQSAAIKVFETYGVNFSIIENHMWEDRSMATFSELSERELLTIGQKCESYRQVPFFILINGRIIAHCCTAGSIMHYYNLYDKYENEYVNLDNTDVSEIRFKLEKLNNRKYMQACQYCIPSWAVKKCQAGEQIR